MIYATTVQLAEQELTPDARLFLAILVAIILVLWIIYHLFR